MRWTLKDRPKILPWEYFVTMPEEIFDFLPEDPEGSRRRHVVSQRTIRTGRQPQVTITRFEFVHYTKFEVELWPDSVTASVGQGGTRKPTTRRTTKTFADVMVEAHKLVQALETAYHPEPLWKYPDANGPRMYTHGLFPEKELLE